MTIEVIAQPGAAPDAVLSYAGLRSTKKACRPLQLPSNAIFDAKLSRRWDLVVFCTAEFSAWWHRRNGRPRGFFLRTIA